MSPSSSFPIVISRIVAARSFYDAAAPWLVNAIYDDFLRNTGIVSMHTARVMNSWLQGSRLQNNDDSMTSTRIANINRGIAT
jgi:hypothetical protein